MLRRTILCGAFAVAWVFPCVAYAKETEAKFWRNAADVAAYQDMVCMGKFGLPVPPFPPTKRRRDPELGLPVIYVQRFTLEDGEVVVEGEMTKADFRFCFGLRAPVVQHPVSP